MSDLKNLIREASETVKKASKLLPKIDEEADKEMDRLIQKKFDESDTQVLSVSDTKDDIVANLKEKFRGRQQKFAVQFFEGMVEGYRGPGTMAWLPYYALKRMEGFEKEYPEMMMEIVDFLEDQDILGKRYFLLDGNERVDIPSYSVSLSLVEGRDTLIHPEKGVEVPLKDVNIAWYVTDKFENLA